MVIKKKDADWRANYCQVLLECSVGNRKIIAFPLAFGEVSVKERVKRVVGMDGCKACLMNDGWYELDDSMSISIYDMIQKGLFQKEVMKNVNYLIESKYTQEDIDSAIEIIL